MAVTQADFNRIWASTSPLKPYNFSNTNYLQGWNFVGSTPPARQMWDFLQKRNDEKAQWLYNNKLSLSGGTMTGVVNGVTPPNSDNSKKLATTEFVVTAISNMMHALYPVGSYIYSDKSANPSTYLPYMSDTTWTQTAQGRVLVGAGTGTDANGTAKTFAAGSTGGEYTHKLTVNEMADSSVCFMPNTTTSPIDNIRAINDSSQTIGPSPTGFATNAKVKMRNDGMPIPEQSNANVTQPYTAVYIWKRTK